MFDSDWQLVIYLDPAGVVATFEHPTYLDDPASDDCAGQHDDGNGARRSADGLQHR